MLSFLRTGNPPLDAELERLAGRAQSAGELETAQVLLALLIARRTGNAAELVGRCGGFCDDLRVALGVGPAYGQGGSGSSSMDSDSARVRSR